MLIFKYQFLSQNHLSFMTLKKNTTRFFFLLIVSFCVFFVSGNLTASSNQATVPINITVEGKLIITDAENDNKSGSNPTLNVNLKLIPDLNNSVVSGSSSIRIRTNLNSWKLTAQRSNLSDSAVNMDPKDISLSFTTQAGSKANPNAGKLLSPFNNQAADLSRISTNGPTDVLIGVSKTSLDRDPENRNNWFQLTSNYSVSPDFFYEIGDWNTTISYSLVSP